MVKRKELEEETAEIQQLMLLDSTLKWLRKDGKSQMDMILMGIPSAFTM